MGYRANEGFVHLYTVMSFFLPYAMTGMDYIRDILSAGWPFLEEKRFRMWLRRRKSTIDSCFFALNVVCQSVFSRGQDWARNRLSLLQSMVRNNLDDRDDKHLRVSCRPFRTDFEVVEPERDGHRRKLIVGPVSSDPTPPENLD